MSYPFILIIAGFFAGSVAATEIDPEDWLIERKELSEPLDLSTQVSVINPYGDIRVRNHRKPEVYLLVNAQRHKDDPLKHKLEICEADGVMEITAHRKPHEDDVPVAFEKRRMDMTVFLPRETAIHLRTNRGFVESRGMAGPLEIITEWGNVRARHAGPLEIDATYGDVEASILDTRWPQDSKIETLTGAIEVRVANGGDLEVELESNGELTTDYTMAIDFNEETGLKSARSSLGKGGSLLRLKSSRGSISLLRLGVNQPDE